MSLKSSHYDVSERKILLRLVDVFIVIISLWLITRYTNFNYVVFDSPGTINWLLLLAGYYLVFGEIFQLYNLSVSNNRYLVIRSIVLTAFVTTIFYIFTPYIAPSLPENRLQIIYLFLIISIPVFIWRFVYMTVIFSPKYFKNVVFIGESSRMKKMLDLIEGDNLHNLSAYISDKSLGNIAKFKDISKTKLTTLISKEIITEVIVSTKGLPPKTISSINKELILLFEYGVNIKSFENFYEEVTDRVPKEYLNYNFYQYINFSRNNTNRFYLFGIRFLDVIISFFGIVVFVAIAPLLLLGNAIGNRGPLFYTQQRIGKNGKEFKIYKLRSMIKNAEINGAVWAKKKDNRITAFGRLLRNMRLDEMPQFYNIIKGDMSLIGPRPERPKFVKDLEAKIPFYAIRHVVRPGLTGWAQVNYPYANTIEEQEIKLRYDLYYIKKRNTFLDFKILIKTITTILFFKGQ